MNLSLLRRFSEQLASHQTLVNLKRTGDNLFKLECDNALYYIDLTRGRSTAFIAPPLFGMKQYQAPFDLSLQRYAARANILWARVEGGNRILQIGLENRGSYKSLRSILQLEFTGRNTNAILLDEAGVVIDALRHIGNERSFREVKIGQKLDSLPEPSKPLTERALPEGLGIQELLEMEYQKRLERELLERQKGAILSIEKKRDRLLLSLSQITNEEELAQEAKRLRGQGALLLANLYKLSSFSPCVKLESQEGEVSLEMPPLARSFSEAAQIFFESSKKLEQKAKNLHIEREMLEDKILFYNRQMALIKAAKSVEDVMILAPKKQRAFKSEEKKEEFESFFIEGVKVSFGKNERENVKLLQSAKAEDTWLHVRDIPSSHMILRGGKGKIHANILQKAAEILVGFLDVSGGNYWVDFTKRKFVKITEGAQVVYAKHETITVKKE